MAANTPANPGLISGTEARAKARLCGVLYLGTIATGLFAVFARMGMIAGADPAVTAAHIRAGEGLFRAAFTAEIVGTACYVAVTALLYDLLKPAGPTLSRIAAFFSLVGCALGAVASAFLLGAILMLGKAPWLAALPDAQVQILAMLAIKLHGHATLMGMVYFGVYCALLGTLVLRSTYLPKVVGAFLLVAGAGWMVDTFTYFLAPDFNRALGSLMMIPGLIGEGSLTVWLLAVGVNPPRWDARQLAPA